MSGKGSAARPYSVTPDQFADNFDAIFGKKKPCEHLATIARPEDDIAILECISCGENLTWLQSYALDDDSAARSAANSEAQDVEHQSAPLPSSKSQ